MHICHLFIGLLEIHAKQEMSCLVKHHLHSSFINYSTGFSSN